jgi:hypothetical protein
VNRLNLALGESAWGQKAWGTVHYWTRGVVGDYESMCGQRAFGHELSPDNGNPHCRKCTQALEREGLKVGTERK